MKTILKVAVLKYILFLITLIVIITMPVSAQNDFAFNFNSGYIGGEWDFPMNEDYNSFGSFTLLNVGIEHEPTNIGFELSFYKNYRWKDSDDNEREDHSFFNLNLYWNAFTVFDGLVYFGTFASVNYLFVKEDLYWDRYIFTVGGRFGFRVNADRLNYNLGCAEIGYRNINGTGKFYIGVKVDAVVLFLFIFAAAGSNSSSSK